MSPSSCANAVLLMTPDLVCSPLGSADMLPCALQLMMHTMLKRVLNKRMLRLRLMVPFVALAKRIELTGLSFLAMALLCLVAKRIDLAEWSNLTEWIDLGLSPPEPSVAMMLLLLAAAAAPCK